MESVSTWISLGRFVLSKTYNEHLHSTTHLQVIALQRRMRIKRLLSQTFNSVICQLEQFLLKCRTKHILCYCFTTCLSHLLIPYFLSNLVDSALLGSICFFEV